MSDDIETTVSVAVAGGFGGKRLTPDEAQAILPILEAMRQGSLDRNDQLLERFEALQRENERLRRELEVARYDQERYWMIRKLLSDRPVEL